MSWCDHHDTSSSLGHTLISLEQGLMDVHVCVDHCFTMCWWLHDALISQRQVWWRYVLWGENTNFLCLNSKLFIKHNRIATVNIKYLTNLISYWDRKISQFYLSACQSKSTWQEHLWKEGTGHTCYMHPTCSVFSISTDLYNSVMLRPPIFIE